MSQEKRTGGSNNGEHSLFYRARHLTGRAAGALALGVATTAVMRALARRHPVSYFTPRQLDVLRATGVDASGLPLGVPFPRAEGSRPVTVSLREHFGRHTEGRGVRLSVPTEALEHHVSQTGGRAAMGYSTRNGLWVVRFDERGAFKASEKREGVDTTPGRLILGPDAVDAAIGSYIPAEKNQPSAFVPMTTTLDGIVTHQRYPADTAQIPPSPDFVQQQPPHVI